MWFSRISVLALGCVSMTVGQQGNTPRLGTNAPSIGYREVSDWPVPLLNAAGTPAPWNFIQVSGVAVDSRGRILVLHRGAQPLLEFESDGKFVRFWDSVKFSEGKVAAVAQADRIPGNSGYSVVYGPAGCDSCGVHSVRMDREHKIWVVDAAG